MPEVQLLDTNVLVRFLTADPPDMAEKFEQFDEVISKARKQVRAAGMKRSDIKRAVQDTRSRGRELGMRDRFVFVL